MKPEKINEPIKAVVIEYDDTLINPVNAMAGYQRNQNRIKILDNGLDNLLYNLNSLHDELNNLKGRINYLEDQLSLYNRNHEEADTDKKD